MNKYIALLISFILFSTLHSKDYEFERGMGNLIGKETWSRCSEKLASKEAKEYELSYERSTTMPKSPFAGEYEPKFLPPVGLAGSKQIYNMASKNKVRCQALGGAKNHVFCKETNWFAASCFPPVFH